MKQAVIPAVALFTGLILGMFIERATAPTPVAGMASVPGVSPRLVPEPTTPESEEGVPAMPRVAPTPAIPVAHAAAATAATPSLRHAGSASPAPADTITIPRSILRSLHVPAFKMPGTGVSDEMVALLQMTDDERARLNDLAARTKAAIEEEKFARATVNEQSEGRVVLTIKGDADAAEQKQATYRAAVTDILGGDRASLFMEKAQTQIPSVFENFGLSDNTLTVTRDEGSDMLRFESKQTYKREGGSGSMSSTYMSKDTPEPWKKYFQSPE